MTVTIKKTSFQRLQTRIINYRDYRRFQTDVFSEELLTELVNENIVENEEGFSNLLDICKENLNYYDLSSRNMHKEIKLFPKK